jgi:hypothetical protein
MFKEILKLMINEIWNIFIYLFANKLTLEINAWDNIINNLSIWNK